MKRLWHKAAVGGIIVMILVLLLVALPACGGGAPEVSAPSEIVVGSTMMLTGMGTAMGQGMNFGVQAAFEDINKLGGIYMKEYDRRLPVRHVVLDNESDPVKAGTLTENLVVSEKVDFLVNGGFPPISAAMSNVAEKYRVPMLTFCGPFEPNHALREAAGG